VNALSTKDNKSTIELLLLAAILGASFIFMRIGSPEFGPIWSVLLIGVICTGVAYILFFRLIAALGPAKAISVTYLIPAFDILWGALFLDKSTSLMMITGGAVILFGVALTTGVLKRK